MSRCALTRHSTADELRAHHRHLRAAYGISRFGTMFFVDPAAAFANIASALRPRARLVLLVWQRCDANEWARVIDAALGEAAQPPPRGADPFSLGDADATARILERAGFDDMRFEDVHEPVVYGHDPDAAGPSSSCVRRSRLTTTRSAAWFSNARSWLITARRHR